MTVLVDGVRDLICWLRGHAELDTSDIETLTADTICWRCGRQEVRD
jgi:hypothetical protein